MTQRRQHDVDSIVTIAFDTFRNHGFDATSMSDLAEAAGVTKAAIYHHLPSKDSILHHGLDRALRTLEAVDTEPPARQDSAIESLGYVLRRVVEIELAFLPEVSVLVRLRGNSEVESNALERRRMFDRNIAKVIRRAQDQGAVRTDLDPKLTTLLILGMITWVTEWYRPDGGMAPATIADTIVGICLQGISTDSARQTKP